MQHELIPLSAGGLWDAVSDPWSQQILRRAFLEVALVGLVAGPLSCWIVFYGLSYSAESLAHGLLPGLVIAALIGAPLVLGAAAGLVVAALAIAAAARAPAIGRDTSVAVVVTTLFGLGVVLALSPASPPGIQGLLFGDVLGVSDLDLALAVGLGALVLGCLWVLHGPLLAVGFDRGSVGSLGISPALVDAALLILIALALLVAVQGLGNLLVVAMLVAPGASAAHLTGRMAPMMATAAALAVAAAFAGIYASFYLGTAAGASIAAAATLTYLGSFAFGLRGLRVRRSSPSAGASAGSGYAGAT
jgi:ABC-type Mn2+/Zn2+ transport system permease subunit